MTFFGGNFVINTLDENQSLINLLRSYEQIVKDSTHITGSLLYIHQYVYFSDHNAVKLRVPIVNTVLNKLWIKHVYTELWIQDIMYFVLT